MTSIRNNLLAFALVATLIPSLGLGLVTFWRYQQVVGEQAARELRTLAAQSSTELALWQRERTHELRTLATAYTLIDGLSDAGPAAKGARIGAAEVALYLKSVQRKLDPVLELTVFDAAGSTVASSAAAPDAVALPASWPQASAGKGVVVAPPRRDGARATATLAIALPVVSVRNEQVGALAAVFDMGTLAPRLRDVVGAAPADIVIVAADGTPLVGTRPNVDAYAPIDATTMLRLRGDNGAPIVFAGADGRDVLGVAASSAALPVLVVAERDRAQAYAAWLDLLKLYATLVAALTLLVAIVAYGLGRSIVTPLTALTSAAERIASGETDVKLRDDAGDEIGRLTRVFNRMAERVRATHVGIAGDNEALREQQRKLEMLADTDSLTGLANRRKFDAFLAEEFARWRIHGKAFALLLIDVDNLAAIRAGYGLATGDEVLTTLAALLKQSVRAVDLVARYGGDTFVAVLPDTPFDSAMIVAERIRDGVAAPGFRAAARDVAVTLCIGVAQAREGDVGPETVLFRADHGLHEARRAGGNRVQSAM
ncbi:MAG: diguanylate cyclase [Burkholderiales bacterium]